MIRFFGVLLAVFFIYIAVTYLLHLLFKRRKFVKYIPALLSFVAVIYNIYMARFGGGEGFHDLARVILAMMLGAGVFAGVLCGIILDFALSRKTL